eukprot:1317739-Pyramimonas_sp.AAC.1
MIERFALLEISLAITVARRHGRFDLTSHGVGVIVLTADGGAAAHHPAGDLSVEVEAGGHCDAEGSDQADGSGSGRPPACDGEERDEDGRGPKGAGGAEAADPCQGAGGFDANNTHGGPPRRNGGERMTS